MRVWNFLLMCVLVLGFTNAQAQEYYKRYFVPGWQSAGYLSESYDGGYVFTLATQPYGNLTKTDLNGKVLWQKWWDLGAPMWSKSHYLVGGSTNRYKSDTNELNAFFLGLNACGEAEKKIIFLSDSIYTVFDIEQDSLKNRFLLLDKVPRGGCLLKLDSNYNIVWKKATYCDNARLKFSKDNQYIYIYGSTDLDDTDGLNLTMFPYIEKIDPSTGQTFWLKCKRQDEMPMGDLWDFQELDDELLFLSVTDRTRGFQLKSFWMDGKDASIKSMKPTLDTIYEAGNNYVFRIAPNRILQIVGVDSPANKFARNTYTHLTLLDTSGQVLQTKSYPYPQYKFNLIDAIYTSDHKILANGWAYTKNAAGYQDFEDVALYRFKENLELDSFETDTNTYDYKCNHKISSDTISLDDADTINLDRINWLGVSQLSLVNTTSSIQVYPIPSNEFINVTNIPMGVKLLQVYDISGKVVLQKALKGESSLQLATKFLSNGIYFLQIAEFKTKIAVRHE